MKGEITIPKTIAGAMNVVLLSKIMKALIDLYALTGHNEYAFTNKFDKPYKILDDVSKY